MFTIEELVLAHRYLYHVLKTPIVDDANYDLLWLMARKWAKEGSPILKPGSNVAMDYDSKTIVVASTLLNSKPKPPVVKNDRKIFVVGGDNGYANWMEGEITKDMKEATLVVFTGGEDISPSLYGKRPHPATLCNPIRDRKEVLAFDTAHDLHIPMIGVCRGAQLLCAMAGGTLVQHQQNEYGVHVMKTSTGPIEVTSSHHQAQFPWGIHKDERIILGWTVGLSRYHHGESHKEELVTGAIKDHGDPLDLFEVEAAYYRKINALAIQGHPEWQYPPETPNHRASLMWHREKLNLMMMGEL